MYAGEAETEQLGIALTEALEFGTGPITESFDEPQSMDEVLAIANPFIVEGN